MERYFKKIKTKYERDGLWPTVKKSINFLLAIMVRRISYDRSNQKRWKELKDKYKGKRVFLIGNGPSLNETPLYLLKDEYTMCFNRINILFERLSWKPTFYTCVDGTVVQDNAEEINKQILPQVAYGFFTDFHMFQFVNIKKRIDNRDNVLWLYQDVDSFTTNMPKVGRCPTVALAAMQILPYLGFSEIYILGMDMNYKIHTTVNTLAHNEIQSKDDDDPNHFDPRYFGKGKKYHQPTKFIIDNTFEALEGAREGLLKTGTKIYNATFGGKLEIFPRIGFNDLFSFSDDEKFRLFADSFKGHIIAADFEELQQKVPFADEIELDGITRQNFMIDLNAFKKHSNTLLFSYIPFGPYNGLYLLVKRP